MTEKLEQMVNQLAAGNVELQQELKESNKALREANIKFQQELKEVQEARVAEANRFQEDLRVAREAQHAEVNRVIVALGGMAQVPNQGDVAIRAKNILQMRKSQRVKLFSEKNFTGNKSSDQKPSDWLKRCEEELNQQRDMANVGAPLSREEWMPCFMDKIDFETRERLETAMANQQPAAYTWAAVAIQDIKDLLCAEFGVMESKVNEVFIQFGPNRYKKPAEMGEATFYHKWAAQLPACMMPSSDEEYKELADLIKRSLFYLNLDNAYLQEELCKIKEYKQKLPRFLEEAVKAEAHRKVFVEIGTTGAALDTTQGVTVAQWDVKQKHKTPQQAQSGKKPVNKNKKNWAERSTDGNSGSNKATTASPTTDQPKSKNKPNRGNCHICEKPGHWANECWYNEKNNKNYSKKSQKPQFKKSEVVQDSDEDLGFHALRVETSLNSIKTETRACLTTNDPIMTSVSLEDTIVSRFECDTAASHSVMAKDVFMELRHKLGGHRMLSTLR